MRIAKNLPADVERYVQEHLDQGNPPEVAWPLAWSRFCKYKSPGHESCSGGPEDYFTGKQASARRVAAAHLGAVTRIRTPVRNTVSRALVGGGFGGKKRWPRLGAALVELGAILEEFSLEIVEIISADELMGDSGRKNFRYGVSAPEPGGEPQEVVNSYVTFLWTRLAPDSYEVVAYLS